MNIFQTASPSHPQALRRPIGCNARPLPCWTGLMLLVSTIYNLHAYCSPRYTTYRMRSDTSCLLFSPHQHFIGLRFQITTRDTLQLSIHVPRSDSCWCGLIYKQYKQQLPLFHTFRVSHNSCGSVLLDGVTYVLQVSVRHYSEKVDWMELESAWDSKTTIVG